MGKYIKYTIFLFGILSFLWGYFPPIEKEDPEITKILSYYHTHKRMINDLFDALEKNKSNFYLYNDIHLDSWVFETDKDSTIISPDSIIIVLNHKNINLRTLNEISSIRKISTNFISINLEALHGVFLKKKHLSSQINYDKVTLKKDGRGRSYISIDDKIDIVLMRRLDMHTANINGSKFLIKIGLFFIFISLTIFVLEKVIERLKSTRYS